MKDMLILHSMVEIDFKCAILFLKSVYNNLNFTQEIIILYVNLLRNNMNCRIFYFSLEWVQTFEIAILANF